MSAATPLTWRRSGDQDHYLHFTRADWRQLRAGTPLVLTEAELERLRGQNESISLDEVADIYLPLSRLLNLYVTASQELYRVTSTFLSQRAPRVPYLIGMAGSVAVGKSTTARILRTLLSRWPQHPRVDLLTTDGFLYPNAVLREKRMMLRKGFPESYRLDALIAFLRDIKAGRPRLRSPVYSHHTYDILPGRSLEIDQPDIVIVEGLNVLQSGHSAGGHVRRAFVSDFFDFTIYVDAPTAHIKRWYVDRFLAYRHKAQGDPSSYFHRFAVLSDEEAGHHARNIWQNVNRVNLLENILLTRERAQLILEKKTDHSIEHVHLRKR